MFYYYILTLLILLTTITNADDTEPNPPDFPSDSVFVFSPDTPLATIRNATATAFARNGGHDPPNHGQFSVARYAFLFEAGTYDVDVPVGYYTQIMGLGASPSDVVFTGQKGVYCEEGDYAYDDGALSTFWRSAENFRTTSAHDWSVGKGMMWAASQASPLRRIVVDNDLNLYEYQPPYQAAGYSSGGFVANARVAGRLNFGSQQQFIARNVAINSTITSLPVWNGVFVGCDGDGAPVETHCGTPGPVVADAATPTIAEKPYLSFANGRFALNVPRVRTNASGPSFDDVDSVDLSNVYVARADRDTAATINGKLESGLAGVVLSPGVYALEDSLRVTRANQVVLGLGLATLVAPTDGRPAIVVEDVPGVRVAGLILETPAAAAAGVSPSSELLLWGTSGTYPGDASNPGFLQDVYCRVGVFPELSTTATSTSGADAMVRIAAGHTVVDNAWLWRADHDASGVVPVTPSSNRVAHGLVVAADDVTAYGLAVEHTLEDLTIWEGERGRVFFYQSELPYGADASFDYAGYRVGDNVTAHDAWGVGVYHFFRDHVVKLRAGIYAPKDLERSFRAPLVVYLSGKGTISHVINDAGGATGEGAEQTAYVC